MPDCQIATDRGVEKTESKNEERKTDVLINFITTDGDGE